MAKNRIFVPWAAHSFLKRRKFAKVSNLCCKFHSIKTAFLFWREKSLGFDLFHTIQSENNLFCFLFCKSYFINCLYCQNGQSTKRAIRTKVIKQRCLEATKTSVYACNCTVKHFYESTYCFFLEVDLPRCRFFQRIGSYLYGGDFEWGTLLGP